MLYAIEPVAAFALGAALLLIGVPAVLKELPPAQAEIHAPRLALAGRLSLPLHSVFAYGVAEATLVSLFPVYLLQRGYSVGELSVAFSAFVAGGLLSTLPVTHLADRWRREPVLLGCALVGVLATLGLVHFSSVEWITACAVLAGASLGPVFALSLALVGATLSREELPAGSALFTAAFSLGSMVAPLLTGLLMARLGAEHVFSLTAFLFLGLLLRLMNRMRLPGEGMA
jgi:MFS family permease